MRLNISLLSARLAVLNQVLHRLWSVKDLFQEAPAAKRSGDFRCAVRVNASRPRAAPPPPACFASDSEVKMMILYFSLKSTLSLFQFLISAFSFFLILHLQCFLQTAPPLSLLSARRSAGPRLVPSLVSAERRVTAASDATSYTRVM